MEWQTYTYRSSLVDTGLGLWNVNSFFKKKKKNLQSHIFVLGSAKSCADIKWWHIFHAKGARLAVLHMHGVIFIIRRRYRQVVPGHWGTTAAASLAGAPVGRDSQRNVEKQHSPCKARQGGVRWASTVTPGHRRCCLSPQRPPNVTTGKSSPFPSQESSGWVRYSGAWWPQGT